MTRKEGKTKLSPQEELALLVGHLERHGYHPRTRDEYVVKDGVREKKVVRDIFFMSDDQIRMARRFVSGFIYETDATFNTNTLRLPLSVMVGIDNTGCTFPMAFMFIMSESAKSFTFVSEQLTDLCFYDCAEAAIICGDFSKGLGASIALRARQELSTKELSKDGKEGFFDIDDVQEAALDPKLHGASELLEGDTIVVDVGVGYQGQRVLLQLCEWHAIEAIKRRLIHAGYALENRKPIVDSLWKWVKAESREDLETARTHLLSQLHQKERDYLQSFYQPKEIQFCHAYTNTYVNLGVYST